MQTRRPNSNSLISWKNAQSPSRPSTILWSDTQVTWTERVFWLVGSHQHTFTNRSQIKYEFINTKKLSERVGENRGKFYLSPTFCQRVCRPFLSRSHTPTWVCQHEFANFSLPCEGRFTFCTHTRSFARANDARIVRSRDAQCNTNESPWRSIQKQILFTIISTLAKIEKKNQCAVGS